MPLAWATRTAGQGSLTPLAPRAPINCPLLFQILGAMILGFGVWILADKNSYIFVLRKEPSACPAPSGSGGRARLGAGRHPRGLQPQRCWSLFQLTSGPYPGPAADLYGGVLEGILSPSPNKTAVVWRTLRDEEACSPILVTFLALTLRKHLTFSAPPFAYSAKCNSLSPSQFREV